MVIEPPRIILLGVTRAYWSRKRREIESKKRNIRETRAGI
jgi:hypothetical protein